LVRATIILIILQPAINISLLLVIQDLYPARKIDVEMSDENNKGQKEPASDDVEGEGAPLVETLALNLIGSSLAEMSRPSTVDQTTTTTPLGGGQKKDVLRLRAK
jgi:hypothetical protein